LRSPSSSSSCSPAAPSYLIPQFARLPTGRSDRNVPVPQPLVFCTMDAKTCPDGSAVGRDPSNGCEFYPCPADDDAAWSRVCTQEAKMCADGSSVGRDSDRACAFDPCPDEGTVSGKLTLVSTCPYERTFDKPCPTSPYEGDVRIEPLGGRKVTLADVEAGVFYATLPAGTYKISSGRALPNCDAKFTVAIGQDTAFSASCDAGVR
jgi:hypothetical protein